MLLEIFLCFQCIAEMKTYCRNKPVLKLDLLFSKFSEKRIWVFAGCDAKKAHSKANYPGYYVTRLFFHNKLQMCQE